jgi:hypothetical protein
MVASLSEANLVAEVDEVRGETKLSDSAEGDEQEQIRVISRLEGRHCGGDRRQGLVGGRANGKFRKRSYTCGTC